EWRAHNGETVTLFELGSDGEGVVVAEPTPAFQPTPLCRSVRVQPIPDIGALAALLAPARSALECARVASGWAPARRRLDGVSPCRRLTDWHATSCATSVRRPHLRSESWWSALAPRHCSTQRAASISTCCREWASPMSAMPIPRSWRLLRRRRRAICTWWCTAGWCRRRKWGWAVGCRAWAL